MELKVVCFSLVCWNSKSRADYKAAEIRRWYEQVTSLISPDYVFLASGTYSDPAFSPIPVPVINAGVPYTKSHDVVYWCYACSAESAAMWHAVLNLDCDYLIQIATDTIIRTDVRAILEKFSKREEMICAPLWAGHYVEDAAIIYKRAALIEFLNRRQRSNLTEKSSKAPPVTEVEKTQIFGKKRWWNPWPACPNVRQEVGTTNEIPDEYPINLNWPFVLRATKRISERWSKRMLPENMPKITVFTSCYNQGKYLTEAIRGVLEQTVPFYEYILIDDGSTDNTWEIIQKFAAIEPRIRAVKREKSSNVGEVINESIDMMEGDVWVWAPADDVLMPKLLEKKAILAEQLRGDSVIYSEGIQVDENGNSETPYSMEVCDWRDFAEKSFRQCFVGFTGIWIPRRIFDRYGKFPTHLSFSEDYYWMLKTAFAGARFEKVAAPLFKKRAHGERLTAKNKENMVAHTEDIRVSLQKERSNFLDIPKVMNFFWGGGPISWLRTLAIKSFVKFNPNWKVILWHDTYKTKREGLPWQENFIRQDFFNYSGFGYDIGSICEHRNWAAEESYGLNLEIATASQRSNFFKWELLATSGGFYSDMDLIYTKPMTAVTDCINENGFDTALAYDGKTYSIGFMFSRPNNRVFAELHKAACQNFKPQAYQGAGVMVLSAKWPTLDDLKKEFSYSSIYNIPMRLVYPFNSTQFDKIFSEAHDLPAESIGLHWYAGCELAQRANNSLMQENYEAEDTTLSRAIRKVLN